MMKRLCLSLVAIAVNLAVFAQTVQDGVKFLYYEQYQKAKEVFNKLVAANPADAEANYWLGQTLIDDDSVAAARAHYAKAMTATSQNPLIMVGMGHVELLEKKNAEARAHFDAAIEVTKSKKNKNFGDPQILAAVGRANAGGGTDIGDPVYGIEKLNQASQLDPTNPEIMLNIGISQLKRGGEYGGEAKKAFDAALERNPKYAKSYMRIGRIFETQKNTPLFLENYNKAIEADPAFSPAYLQLYTYYQNRDVNKAKELLDKYIANTEKNRETDFFYADYLFRAGKYQESLAKAKELEATLNGEAYPKIHKLFAYNYDRLGDSITAKKEMDLYMTQENPAKLTGDSYAYMAALALKADKDAVKAEENITKALAVDTVLENKIGYMRTLADAFAANQDFKGQYKWLNNMMAIRADTTARNYYFIIDAAIKAGEYGAADSFSSKYIASYPDQPQGYFMRNKAAILADADTSLGTALPAIEQYNAFLMADTAKNKNRIISNIGYKVYYFANKAKDYPKAIEALNEILALDPSNSYALSAKKQLEQILNKKSLTPKKTTGKLNNPVNSNSKYLKQYSVS
ncbi:MAG: tetratricopeptide repeat protein [Bacteroidota bacterium]